VSVLDFIKNYGVSIKSMNVRYSIIVVLVLNVDRTIAKVYAFGNSSYKNIENLSFLGYPTLK
jgi:hypothetical protein